MSAGTFPGKFKQGLGALDTTWVRSNRNDSGGGDDATSVATSTVSLICTNHLLTRMEERRITIRELQHTKKHGTKSVDPKTGNTIFRHNELVYITAKQDRIGVTAYRRHWENWEENTRREFFFNLSLDSKTCSVGRQHAPEHVVLGRAHQFRSRTRGKTRTLIRAHRRGRAGRRGIKHLGKRTSNVRPGPRALWMRQLLLGLSTYPGTREKEKNKNKSGGTNKNKKPKQQKKKKKKTKKMKKQRWLFLFGGFLAGVTTKSGLPLTPPLPTAPLLDDSPAAGGATAGPGIRGRRDVGVPQKPKQQTKQKKKKKKTTKSSLPPPHERVHATETVPFCCSFCLKQFSRQSQATRHERTHTGEKPYACTMCPKRFSRKTDVTPHERTHTSLAIRRLSTPFGIQKWCGSGLRPALDP